VARHRLRCWMRKPTFAEIAEITVDNGKRTSEGSNESYVAQDMGIVINPEGATMQMEGCIMMGLGYTCRRTSVSKAARYLTTNLTPTNCPLFMDCLKLKPFWSKTMSAAEGWRRNLRSPDGAVVANRHLRRNRCPGGINFRMTPERLRGTQDGLTKIRIETT